jgi:Cu/Ag efflux protein CusF
MRTRDPVWIDGRKILISWGVMLLVLLLFTAPPGPAPVRAAGAVEFPGTVLKVDQAAGKVTVKKEGSGTRFTFVVNAQTTYKGAEGLAGLKPGDAVTVHYVTEGSTYLAKAITRTPK